MLDEYKTSDRFWAEAVNTACYAINRLYLHRILKKTSYELLTGKKPNVSYFRVVGTMLRRRRSCGKKQLRLKLLVRDAEGTIHEASVLQHIRR
jgi:hypothetical protein